MEPAAAVVFWRSETRLPRDGTPSGKHPLPSHSRARDSAAFDTQTHTHTHTAHIEGVRWGRTSVGRVALEVQRRLVDDGAGGLEQRAQARGDRALAAGGLARQHHQRHACGGNCLVTRLSLECAEESSLSPRHCEQT